MRVNRREISVTASQVHVPLAQEQGEAEEALFEDRVPSVPQGERKAQPLMVVADASETALTPTIGS